MYRLEASAYVRCSMKTDDIQRRLGRRISDARRKRGYTQEQLGVRAGFTMKFVSTVERGLVNMPLSTLAVIARALGVTISELTLGCDGALPQAAREAGAIYAGRSRGEQMIIAKLLGVIDELVAEAQGK